MFFVLRVLTLNKGEVISRRRQLGNSNRRKTQSGGVSKDQKSLSTTQGLGDTYPVNDCKQRDRSHLRIPNKRRPVDV